MPAEKLKHRLGDQWSTGDPIAFLTVINPFSGEPVAEVPVAGQADVAAAVAAAAQAATWWVISYIQTIFFPSVIA